MKRQKAISKASNFLGKKGQIKTGSTAKTIKERAKRNDDLNRGSLNQILADVYQRGVDPKDIDLEKIDWSVSYNNIRNQIKDLLDKRGAGKFQNRKDAERKASMDYAAKKGSEQLKTVARVRHERRPPHNQYVDETKNAERTFGRLTDSSFQKWSRNMNKYDIEGVDGRSVEGKQKPLPLKRSDSSRIKDMRMSNVEQDLSDPQEDPGFNTASVAFSESRKLDQDVVGDKVKLSDSRSNKDVSKNLKGGTKERSSQKGLRDGFASKKSESTLDKFDGNYV